MIIGTAGHIDHGKTALVHALTGIDTDRLKEEKKRGISIDLGFAYISTPTGLVLGFVDVPGHEKFIHNMLAGATGIEFALLVIAATEGVMPQTVEHLAILDLLGINRGIVALTKWDKIEPRIRHEVSDDIIQTLSATTFANNPVVPVSSITGEGIEKLRSILFESSVVTTKQSHKRFRLAIDRTFILPGAGTIVTGTVLSGSVFIGDHVVISPSGLPARVRSIHAQNRASENGVAGQRCALNLAGDGVSKDQIARGDMIIDPELHAPTDRLDASLRVLATEPKSVTQWMPARLHHTTREVGARIVLLSEEPIEPGSEGRVQLVLEQPIPAAVGDRFVLRDISAQRTIGGGRFLDLRAPTRRRRTQERSNQLDAHSLKDDEQALIALLNCPPMFVEITAFARDRAITTGELNRIAARAGLVTIPAGGKIVTLSSANWTRTIQSIVFALADFHATNPDLPGIGLDRLRLTLFPALPRNYFHAYVKILAREKVVSVHGAWISLPDHEPRLQAADEAAWESIGALLAKEHRFRPPRVRDIAAVLEISEVDVRRVLKLLSRLAKVDEIARDHFFLRSTTGEMVDIARQIAADSPNNEFTAAAFRDRLNNGRKVAIRILEFFDRHGVTIRRGDLRRINKRRLDLFCLLQEEDIQPSSASGREASPVGRPDFKSGKGRQPVLGGFDSHSLPPTLPDNRKQSA